MSARMAAFLICVALALFVGAGILAEIYPPPLGQTIMVQP